MAIRSLNWPRTIWEYRTGGEPNTRRGIALSGARKANIHHYSCLLDQGYVPASLASYLKVYLQAPRNNGPIVLTIIPCLLLVDLDSCTYCSFGSVRAEGHWPRLFSHSLAPHKRFSPQASQQRSKLLYSIFRHVVDPDSPIAPQNTWSYVTDPQQGPSLTGLYVTV